MPGCEVCPFAGACASCPFRASVEAPKGVSVLKSISFEGFKRLKDLPNTIIFNAGKVLIEMGKRICPECRIAGVTKCSHQAA